LSGANIIQDVAKIITDDEGTATKFEGLTTNGNMNEAVKKIKEGRKIMELNFCST
jgi:hypothetical protein